ncbi:MAG: hypothetical protein NTV51_12380 [Verrucomicrobia bacterium]|nr:hypothetical protein [Verrucomicrobiota bacterium]
MAAFLSIEASGHADQPERPQGVELDDSATYRFLYRYFASANLPGSGPELVDLYGNAEIGGYQLERLVDELRSAEIDVLGRPAEWSVLLGWDGADMKKETERREVLSREKALLTIRSLLDLAQEAQRRGVKLISAGD